MLSLLICFVGSIYAWGAFKLEDEVRLFYAQPPDATFLSNMEEDHILVENQHQHQP